MIAVHFVSKLVSVTDRSRWVLAIDRQLSEHFAPAWSSVVPTVVDADSVTLGPLTPVIQVTDTISVDGALGDHSELGGRIVGEIGVQTCYDFGASPSACLSHEVLEATKDPFVNMWADGPDGVQYAFEMCDLVQDGQYTIDGVDVSNFLLPAAFNPQDAHGPYDFMGALAKPFSKTAGGYSVIRTAGPGSETQLGFRPPWKRSPLSRLARRLKGPTP